MAATLGSKILVENTRYRARGCKKDKKVRHHCHRSRTPSTSPSRSSSQYRSKSHARRSVGRNPDKRDINPTNCPYCKEFGGYGLAHASPKSVPHTKFNYNKKWKGWRPKWVCKKIGVAYKEHANCNEWQSGDLDENHSKEKLTNLTRDNKITTKLPLIMYI